MNESAIEIYVSYGVQSISHWLPKTNIYNQDMPLYMVIPIYKIWNAIIWRIFDPYTVHHQSLRIQLSDKRGPILPIDIFSRSKLCVTARCNNWWPRRKSLWPFLWFSRAVLVYKLLATSNSETLHLKRW